MFLFLGSDGHFVQQSRSVYAILVEGIMRNISAKLFFAAGPAFQAMWFNDMVNVL